MRSTTHLYFETVRELEATQHPLETTPNGVVLHDFPFPICIFQYPLPPAFRLGNPYLPRFFPSRCFIGTHDMFVTDCRKFKAEAQKQVIEIDYHEYKTLVHVWMLMSLP